MMLDQRGRDAAEQLRRYATERAHEADFGDVRRLDRRHRIVSAFAVMLLLVMAVTAAALLTGNPFSGDETPVVTQPTADTVMPTSSSPPATPVPTTVPNEGPVPAPLLSPEGWNRIGGVPDVGGGFTNVVATDRGFVATLVKIHGGNLWTSPGSLWASPDGIVWSQIGDLSDPVGLGVEVIILDLATNGDRIVALVVNTQDDRTGIASSTDLENWTFAVLGDASSIAAYKDGFIVVGNGIWLSTDGEQYELVHDGTSLNADADGADGALVFSGVTAHGDTAVAYGRDSFAAPFSPQSHGSRFVLVTNNGYDWIESTAPVGIDGRGDQCEADLNDAAFGPNGLVAVGGCHGPSFGGDAHSSVWTSADGLEWTQIPYDEAAFGEAAFMAEVTAGDLGYVAGGWMLESRAAAWLSRDGIHWTLTKLEPGMTPGVAIQDDVVVVVGVDIESRTAGYPAIWRATLTD
jgi:hypothetical protein